MAKTSKSKKKAKPSRGHGGAKRGSPLLIVAATVIAVAAAIALIVVLMPKNTDGPDRPGWAEMQPQKQKQARTRTDTQTPTTADTERPADEIDEDYLALRDETLEVARQLVVDFPQDAFPLGLMGTVQNQFGNTAEAEKWWWKCLDQDPGRADAFDVLAVAFLRKGEFQKVVDLSMEMLVVSPNAPGVYRRQAEALLELGELDEALAAIEKEKRLSPDLNEVHIILGRIHLQRKEYQQATGAYARALELKPGDSRCYFGLATASARLGRSDESKAYMAQFTELRAVEDEASATKRRATDVIARAGPILAETLVDAGRTYHAYGQVEKAEQQWRRAAAVDPANTACRLQLVNLYRKARRGQEAAEVCAQLTRIEPDNAYYHFVTGVVFGELRRFSEAEQALRKSIELAPERPDAYMSLAGLFLTGNTRLSEAQALAEQAVALAPTARRYFMLSQVCSRNQQPAAALAAIERAAELDPNNAQIRQAYEKLKQEQ